MKNLCLKITGLLIGVIGVGCGKPKPLEYLAIQNFKVNTVGAAESVISADVYYYNPNPFRMQLKEAEMDVTVNDKYMGRSSLDTLMAIPRLDTFSIPVHMKVDMKSLLSNSVNALFNNEVDLKLEGRARVGKAGVFFNFPFSYEGKQKFKLF